MRIRITDSEVTLTIDERGAAASLAKDAPLYDEPRHLLREGEGIGPGEERSCRSGPFPRHS